MIDKYEKLYTQEPEFFKLYYSEKNTIFYAHAPRFQIISKDKFIGVKVKLFGRLFAMVFPK